MSETASKGCGGGCACHGGGAKAGKAPAIESKTTTEGTGTARVATQNGKGDAPRNVSRKFRKNYEGIRWAVAGKRAKPGEKLVKIYK
jgi:hypothetical protein